MSLEAASGTEGLSAPGMRDRVATSRDEERREDRKMCPMNVRRGQEPA